MTPEDIAKAGTEHAHQAALFCWANSVKEQYPMLEWMHAIPNGGLRNVATASRLKAEGVKKGVLDVFLPYSQNVKNNDKNDPFGRPGVFIQYHGLYIEMKKPGKGVLTKHQKLFREYLDTVHYANVVCETWVHAAHAIVKYLPPLKFAVMISH